MLVTSEGSDKLIVITETVDMYELMSPAVEKSSTHTLEPSENGTNSC